MKTKQNFPIFLTTLVMMLALMGCTAKKTAFIHSTVVPAAEGYVRITQDKNNNYKIQLDIRNLAKSDKLEPSKATYVIWAVKGDEEPKNLGQLQSTENAVSHALKASFETVSPVKPDKIFITAEDDGNVQTPGDQLILSTGKL
jgi:hypothetical protein